MTQVRHVSERVTFATTNPAPSDAGYLRPNDDENGVLVKTPSGAEVLLGDDAALVGAAVAGAGLTIVGALVATTPAPQKPLGMLVFREAGTGASPVRITRAYAFAGQSVGATGPTTLQLANSSDPAGTGVQTMALTLTTTTSGRARYWASASGTIDLTQTSGQGILFVRCTAAGGHGNITLQLMSNAVI